jgi:asparagine synthase (glutamine-hydrolysing)
VFLSGGVDSSVVAALAAEHKAGMCAFSLGFAEAQFSELVYARKVAAHLEMVHHALDATADDVLECLPHLVTQYGQPFGDASAVPTFLLASLARKHVKVCLSGDGGDESFGGYWRTQSGVYAHRYSMMIPQALRRHAIPMIAGRLGSIGKRWLALNQLSLMAPGAGYTNAESWYGLLSEIAGPRLLPAVTIDVASLRVGYATDRPEASIVQSLLYDDFRIQLPDAYLTKVDVASMAASLEVRAPLLDQMVIETAWCLPDSMKLNWGRRKWLLKKIAAELVPPNAVCRPKMGFAMPLSEWFHGKLGLALERLMDHSVAEAEGYIRADVVRQTLSAHRRDQNNATRLWLVLWLEIWFRIFVDRQSLDLRGLAGDG